MFRKLSAGGWICFDQPLFAQHGWNANEKKPIYLRLLSEFQSCMIWVLLFLDDRTMTNPPFFFSKLPSRFSLVS